MVADFKDRADAGRQLAAAVVRLGLVDPLVLALPRGGVPVAAEVARALHAPLDLLANTNAMPSPLSRNLEVRNSRPK